MSRDLPTLTDDTVALQPRDAAADHAFRFGVEHAGTEVGEVTLTESDASTGTLTWRLDDDHRGRGYATRAVRLLVDWAMTERGQGGRGLSRVEALVDLGNDRAVRVATRSGMRREGVRRVVPGSGDVPETTGYVVLARLDSDPPMSDPRSFRALLNSFLPRKRGIGQMLVRDPEGRVLLCRLTYKQDWDLPGGVVEVDESPRIGVARELTEELGVEIDAGALLLTDWLPPWGGWDDALCLVFDGGVHDPAIVDSMVLEAREIREVAFCTLAEIEERCADFTTRRIHAALARARGEGSPYTESGRALE